MVKGSKATKPYKRLDKTAKEFILSKMAEGLDVLEICQTYPDKCPSANVIYKAGTKGDLFAQQLGDAYGIMYMHRMDRMHDIARTPASQLYPNVADWREAEATKKSVLKEMEFSMVRLAPLFTKRFQQTQVIEHTGVPQTQIMAINYHTLDTTKQAQIDTLINTQAIDIHTQDSDDVHT